ncbi:MAG: 50S ribosomal protein L22 [Solirubrobacterales bacterium]
MAEQKKDAGQQKRKAATKGAESAEKQTAAKQEAGQKSAAKPRKPTAKKEPAKKEPTKKESAKKPVARKPAAKKESAKKPAAKPKAAPRSKEAPERPVVNASARFVRVAPRKARLIADQVRGLPIDDARALLRFSSRGAASDIRKLIESAAANAEANHDLVADDLLIKDIHVDEGPTLRRYRPRALGRATRINKRTSHIAVALTPED